MMPRVAFGYVSIVSNSGTGSFTCKEVGAISARGQVTALRLLRKR